MQSGPNMGVLGNETRLSDGNGRESGDDASARRTLGGESGLDESAIDAVDVIDQVPTGTRKSDAVSGESGLQEYDDVVDEYFRAISE